MKKILLLLLCNSVSHIVFCQNVGIGTITPAFKLDVQGRMRVKTGTLGSLGTTSGIWMEDYRDGTNRFFFGMKDSIRAGFYGSGSGGTGWDFTFNTQNGNIGIGYLDPATYKLTIDGEMGLFRTTQAGTNLYGSLEYNTGNLQINAKTGNIFTSVQPEDLILQYTSGGGNTSGNVGIGTLAPEEKLHVAGNIQVSGEMHRTTTGNANLLPFCYGVVDSSGGIVTGTGNFTAEKVSAGWYRINITNLPAGKHTVLVTGIYTATVGTVNFGYFQSWFNNNTLDITHTRMLYSSNTFLGVTLFDLNFSFVVYVQ